MISLLAVLLFAEPPKLAIPEGHVVYAIKSADRETSGLLVPGSKVDVSVAETVDKGKVKEAVILKGVLIVAVDTALDNDKKLITTVSLAVKPADAKVLGEATKKGQLRLVLRSPGKDKK